MKATFNSKGYQGKVTKTISIETNDPDSRMVRLNMTGEVVTEVSAEPRQLNFGKVNRNEPPKPVRLEIKLSEKRGLAIKSVTSEHDAIVIKRLEETDGGAVYSVGLRNTLKLGRLYGNIVVRTTSSKTPETKIPFYGTVEGNVRATPQFISLGSILPAEEVTREIVLSTTANGSFSVREITSSSEQIKTRLTTVKEGAEYRVAVSYQAGPAAQGRIAERVKIRVESGEEELLEVPVYGTVRKEQPSKP